MVFFANFATKSARSIVAAKTKQVMIKPSPWQGYSVVLLVQ